MYANYHASPCLIATVNNLLPPDTFRPCKVVGAEVLISKGFLSIIKYGTYTALIGNVKYL